MKLHKGSPEVIKCKAKTKSGGQCARQAVKNGYCTQHHRLAEASGKLVQALGNTPYTYIPEPPVVLSKRGNENWIVYCQLLIDEGRLFQAYLWGLSDLCLLEDELSGLQEKIREVGSVNTYNNGVQINGYATRQKQVISDIRSLRSDYGLIGARSNRSASIGSKEGYATGKTKAY